MATTDCRFNLECSQSPIDASAVYADSAADSAASSDELGSLYSDQVGATAQFTGLVRADSKADIRSNAQFSYLEVIDHPLMTLPALERVAESVAHIWGLERLTVRQRVGRLTAGQTIVTVVTAAKSRAQAIDACHCMSDALKSIVPMWKKQGYSDGTSDWLVARETDNQQWGRWLKMYPQLNDVCFQPVQRVLPET